MNSRTVYALVSLALLMASSQAGAQPAKPQRAAHPSGEFTEIKPELVGFSTDRLTRLDQAMQSLVDSKQLAGIVTLLARHGKIV
jgi:hypothetical protein